MARATQGGLSRPGPTPSRSVSSAIVIASPACLRLELAERARPLLRELGPRLLDQAARLSLRLLADLLRLPVGAAQRRLELAAPLLPASAARPTCASCSARCACARSSRASPSTAAASCMLLPDDPGHRLPQEARWRSQASTRKLTVRGAMFQPETYALSAHERLAGEEQHERDHECSRSPRPPIIARSMNRVRAIVVLALRLAGDRLHGRDDRAALGERRPDGPGR